jgi:copper resistance protein B
MSTARILALAAALAGLAPAAAAQTPAATDQPIGGVQPVHDQQIFAHGMFSQLEGRTSGSNTEFRWEGQGWVGTDYDRLWIKSEGTLQGNGTLDDGQHQFLYSRAITTYFDLQGGCAATSIHAPPAIGGPSASRASRLTFSISNSPAM